MENSRIREFCGNCKIPLSKRNVPIPIIEYATMAIERCAYYRWLEFLIRNHPRGHSHEKLGPYEDHDSLFGLEAIEVTLLSGPINGDIVCDEEVKVNTLDRKYIPLRGSRCPPYFVG
jgi:hypothetical protein